MRKPGKIAARVALAGVGLLLALGLAELGLRLGWRGAPTALSSQTDAELLTLVGREELPPVRPGPRTSYYTRYELDADGFRVGPRLAPEGAPEVAVVGDSYVFGIAMPEHATLPARLEAALVARGTPHRVHNVGYPAADLRAGLRSVRRVLRRHHPAWVMIVLGANDLSRVSDAGAGLVRPPLTPSVALQPGEPGPAARLGRWMVPEEGRADGRAPPTLLLARASRLWTWTGLHLRKLGQPARRARERSLCETRAAQVDRLVWALLDEQLAAFGREARAAGARPLLVSWGEDWQAGAMGRHVEAASQRAGVDLLDLTGLWEGGAAAWTLGWDGHPSAAALERAAEAVAAWMTEGRRPPAVDRAAMEVADRAAEEALRARFAPRLDAGSLPDQRLYGWWLPAEVPWASEPPWMSDRASWLLRAEQDSTRLHLAGRWARPPTGASRLSCGEGPPVELPATEQDFATTLTLPAPVPAGAVLECALELDAPQTTRDAGLALEPPAALGPRFSLIELRP